MTDFACSTNLVVILVMMQVSKKIPFEDPQVLMLVRGAYILSNLIIAGVYLYTQQQINKKKGTLYTIASIHNHPADFFLDMTTLKYVEPAPMGSAEEPKLVTTTIHSYDMSQLKSLWKSQAMGIAMMGFMHLYMKYTNPLLIQSLIPLKGAFEGNLVKIHVFGQPAAGDLKRPFKAAAGFMSALGGDAGGVASDKKTIEAAEKAGRGGAKEE